MYSNYDNGFAGGVTVRGVPLQQSHPGQVFWVGNNAVLLRGEKGASNGNDGTFLAPFSTLTYAISAASASRGDVIFVRPGYTETVSAAAGLALSKAGLAIVGLGVGTLRPTVTLDTANTATITVSASNVSIQNFLFKANFLDIATCFDIVNAQVARELTIENCEFRDNSVILNFVKCVRVGTTANIADGLTLRKNRVSAAILTNVPAGQTFMATASIIDRLDVSDNVVMYPKDLADTATLIAAGALDLTNAVIKGNMTFRPATSTTGHLISSSSTACSGWVANNYVAHLDNSAGLIIPTGTKFSFFENYSMVTGAADKSALINPVAV